MFYPNVQVFLAALIVDLLLGEWPSQIHPVVWMGEMTKLFDIPSGKSWVRFFLGTSLLTCDMGVWFFISISTMKLPWILSLPIQVFLLKSTFSIRSLYTHVSRCKTSKTEKLRYATSMIVSRDVSRLDKPHLISAALESLSENTSDSVTAPLFYYTLFGLPFAIVYRVVNTLDAMVGYHNTKYEYFGKVSARLDDALNFIPSRITATVFAIFSPLKAFRSIFKYGSSKINAAYPMSAFSGVLGVWFEKIGVYRFEGRKPTMKDVDRGLKIYILSCTVVILLFSILMVVR